MCKQLPRLEHLVYSFCATSCKDHYWWWCLSWCAFHGVPFMVMSCRSSHHLSQWCHEGASQELSSTLLSENSASTPSSSASCRGKGCCLVREGEHSQKDHIRITLMFNTRFLGTTLGRKLCYFWRGNFGHFKLKSSHIPSPLSQQQPPWDEMEALEVVSQQLQTVTPQFWHKLSTHHSPCLWKHNCAVRFNYIIAEIMLPCYWKSL